MTAARYRGRFGLPIMAISQGGKMMVGVRLTARAEISFDGSPSLVSQ